VGGRHRLVAGVGRRKGDADRRDGLAARRTLPRDGVDGVVPPQLPHVRAVVPDHAAVFPEGPQLLRQRSREGDPCGALALRSVKGGCRGRPGPAPAGGAWHRCAASMHAPVVKQVGDVAPPNDAPVPVQPAVLQSVLADRLPELKATFHFRLVWDFPRLAQVGFRVSWRKGETGGVAALLHHQVVQRVAVLVIMVFIVLPSHRRRRLGRGSTGSSIWT
jgi:hypothetical protein